MRSNRTVISTEKGAPSHPTNPHESTPRKLPHFMVPTQAWIQSTEDDPGLPATRKRLFTPRGTPHGGGPPLSAGQVGEDSVSGGEAAGIKVGDRCQIDLGGRPGEVMFVGHVAELPLGLWVGVKYDDPVGKNDGSIKGVRYFDCLDKHGGFVRPDTCRVADFSECHAASPSAVSSTTPHPPTRSPKTSSRLTIPSLRSEGAAALQGVKLKKEENGAEEAAKEAQKRLEEAREAEKEAKKSLEEAAKEVKRRCKERKAAQKKEEEAEKKEAEARTRFEVAAKEAREARNRFAPFKVREADKVKEDRTSPSASTPRKVPHFMIPTQAWTEYVAVCRRTPSPPPEHTQATEDATPATRKALLMTTPRGTPESEEDKTENVGAVWVVEALKEKAEEDEQEKESAESEKNATENVGVEPERS